MKTPEILISASRQYQHNNCSGLVSGFDHDETVEIVGGLESENGELKRRLELMWHYFQSDKSVWFIKDNPQSINWFTKGGRVKSKEV